MFRYKITSNKPVRPKELKFGLMSAEVIKKQSVVRITETTLYYRGLPASGGLLDPLMGTVDRRHLCATCMCDAHACQGHSGQIELMFPVYHYGFVDTVMKTLRCVCFFCSALCATTEEKGQASQHVPRNARLQHYQSLIRTRRECPACGMPKPTFSRCSLGTIAMTWKETDYEKLVSQEEKDYANEAFTARDALSMLRHISPEDVEHLGFDMGDCHPMHMIVQNLLVPPPITRPAIYSSEGSRSRGQNDLTVRLLEILKRNQDVGAKLQGVHWSDLPSVSQDLLERIARLQSELFILVTPSSRVNRPHGMGRTMGGQNSKSITDRLKGKDGRVRGNLMGKRVNFSSRAVITPDAYFDCDKVGVPVSVATSLTIPETVDVRNMDAMTRRVRRGAGVAGGAYTLIKSDGTVIDLSNYRKEEELTVEVGDIVERYVEDNDTVVFNRQPSLHMHGMQAHRVVLMPGSTFRLSLVAASPYNADFDGDEMNIHVPQSKMASAECSTLMSVSQNCIGAQANKPVLGIVQDTLLANHLLTGQLTLLSSAELKRMIGRIMHAPRAMPDRPALVFYGGRGARPRALYTGKQAFSVLLPRTFHLRVDMRREKEWNAETMPVVVKSGRLLCGVVTKKHVGSAANGIIDVLVRDHSNVAAMQFMSDNQRMMNCFLLMKGHNVGIDDVLVSASAHKRIEERLVKATTLCEDLQASAREKDKETAEKVIIGVLTKILMQTGGIVEEEMRHDNAIRHMVRAGSKGSFINLSQICACLGQQSIEGCRIVPPTGTRTLPCFAHDDTSLASKGMVNNSFALGLDPPELFFHAIGGREGLVDTAVKTSQTGYIQRRMNKAMEDNLVCDNGTICNAMEEVISFPVGRGRMHPSKLERVSLSILEESLEELCARFTTRSLTSCSRFGKTCSKRKRLECQDESGVPPPRARPAFASRWKTLSTTSMPHRRRRRYGKTWGGSRATTATVVQLSRSTSSTKEQACASLERWDMFVRRAVDKVERAKAIFRAQDASLRSPSGAGDPDDTQHVPHRRRRVEKSAGPSAPERDPRRQQVGEDSLHYDPVSRKARAQ